MQKNQTCSKLQLEHELNVFFNNDKALLDEWLDTPIPRFDGQRPRSLLLTEEKRRELLQVLQEMKFGDMA
ncbi:MbcA/ParS/Xre antitoxin family protein [Rheinheimera gaetbuli]